MGKILKSVKIDNEMLNIIEKYKELMTLVIGTASTFTTMVEQGICLFICEQMQMLQMVANEKIIMENGIFKEFSLTKEQEAMIEQLLLDLSNYRDSK